MMTDYNELDRQIQTLKGQTETMRDILGTLQSEAASQIDALGQVREDAEQVEGELHDHIINLEGLQATLEKADSVRDDGETQGISI